MAASRSRLAAMMVTKKRVDCFMRSSELHARPELHAAEVVSGFSYRAKASSPEGNVWKCEPLVIGYVEHLGANLQLGPLTDLEFLRERHVQIANSVAAQIREMPW